MRQFGESAGTLERGASYLRRATGAMVDLRAAALIATGRPHPVEGAVIFAYHDVRPDSDGYNVSPEQLRFHIELARDSGLRFVDVATIVDRLAEGRTVDGLAAVTFDDALLGVGQHAVEMLGQLEIPATIFVVTGRLGIRPDWWRGAQRTLRAAELSALAGSASVHFGSHTETHASLPALSQPALVRELEGSRTVLEDLVGRSIDLLAYPSGHHDARVRAAAHRAGYRAGFTFLNGRSLPGHDLFRLPRLTMGAHHRRPRLAYHLGRSGRSWPETQLDAVATAGG